MAILVLLEATVKAECVNELKSSLKKHFPDTRAYDGCQGITAYLNVDDDRTLVFVEHWDTKEAHQRYTAWRRETGVGAELVSMLEGRPTIRYFETIDA
jgi:quinol monooxygenase YgiN